VNKWLLGAVVGVLLIAGLWALVISPNEEPLETVGSAEASKDAEQQFQAEIKTVSTPEKELLNWVYDKKDPIDHITFSRPYAYLTYPQSPSDVYAEHIEQAKNGDANSMFWVSTSLRECNKVPRSEQEQDSLAIKRSEALVEVLVDRCKGLADLIPEDVSYLEQSNYWLEQAALSGHKTSQAILQVDGGAFSEGSRVYNHARETLINAVQSDGYPAYYEASKYLTLRIAMENRERSQSGEAALPPSSLPKLSWDLAACNLHPGCDSEKLNYMLSTSLYPHQVEEVRAMVTQIEGGGLPGFDSDANG